MLFSPRPGRVDTVQQPSHNNRGSNPHGVVRREQMRHRIRRLTVLWAAIGAAATGFIAVIVAPAAGHTTTPTTHATTGGTSTGSGSSSTGTSGSSTGSSTTGSSTGTSGTTGSSFSGSTAPSSTSSGGSTTSGSTGL